MNITEGEVFRNTSDGVDFIVKKIVNDMVFLQSQDGKRQIVTEVHTLTSTPFYQKRDRHFDPGKYGMIYCPVCEGSGKLFNEVGERVICKICGGFGFIKKGEENTVIYKFYFNDGRGEDSLIGILPERRKNKRRVTRKSIMKWGKLAAGSNADPDSIYYVRLDL